MAEANLSNFQVDSGQYYDKKEKILTDGTVGRYISAKKQISAGTVILKESPLVQGPFQVTVPVCLTCNKELDVKNAKECAKCGWPFCSEACKDTKIHRPECQFTQQKGSKISIKNFGITHPNYQCITVLRCLDLKLTDNDRWQKLLELQSNPTEEHEEIAGFILKFFKLEAQFTQEEIVTVLGILRINGHEIPFTNPPSMAVYESASLFEHNCKANCSKTFTDNAEILIFTATNIKPGDHLSICYTDPLWGTPNRRYHLHQTKYFWCQCARCKDPTEFGTNLSALRCPNEQCTGVVLPTDFFKVSDWSCALCSTVMKPKDVGAVLQETGECLTSMPKGVVADCKTFLKDYSTVLGPHHYYLIDVKMALMQLFSYEKLAQLTDGNLKLKLEIVEELLELVKKLAPAEQRLLGILMFELAMSLEEKNKRSHNYDDLVRIRETLVESGKLLENEPSAMSEGKIHRRIVYELREIDNLVRRHQRSVKN